MSRRVQRSIGYGFFNAQSESSEPGSVRNILNPESPLLSVTDGIHLDWEFDSAKEEWESLLQFMLDYKKNSRDNGVRAYISSISAIGDALKSGIKLPAMHDCIDLKLAEYDDEYDSVVLCLPMSQDGWMRRDDIVDYVESSLLFPENQTREIATEIPAGIYPYNGTYLRKDTLAPLDSHDVTDLRQQMRSPESLQSEIDYLIEDLGFSSREEALSLITPKPPIDITLFALWSNLFKDDKMAHTMKPLFRQYWN